MRRISMLITVLALLALPAPASAQPHVPDDDRIGSGPVDVARGETVSGDVVRFGGPVRVAGRVEGDVVALGGSATVSGDVAGDVVALGGSAMLGPGARVDGDVIAPAGTTRIGARARVGGEVVHGDESPDIDPSASIGGGVQRAGAERFGPAFGLVGLVGPVVSGVAFLGSWGVGTAVSLALGLLLLWLGPEAARAAYEAAREVTGEVVGAGFGFVLGLPVFVALALVTVVGIPLGVVAALTIAPLYALGYAASAWLLGRVLVGASRNRYLAFLAGWGILRLVALVPIASWLAGAAATIFGCGALALVAWRSRRSPSTIAPQVRA